MHLTIRNVQSSEQVPVVQVGVTPTSRPGRAVQSVQDEPQRVEDSVASQPSQASLLQSSVPPVVQVATEHRPLVQPAVAMVASVTSVSPRKVPSPVARAEVQGVTVEPGAVPSQQIT